MTAARIAMPDGWRAARLGEVADIVMGQSPPGNTVHDLNGQTDRSVGLPFAQGNAEFGSRSPNPVKWCVRPAKTALPHDLLISVRAPVGETNRADQALAIGRGLAAVRFTNADAAYGWHILNHAKRAFDRLAQGSTFEAIGGSDLRLLALLLPPLAEQRAIAAVLDSIDEAIEGADEVIAATTRLRDALLHELLTRGLPGRHSEWREVPGLGTIPACWDAVRLGDVLTSTTYGTNVALHETGDVAVLRMNNIQGGRIDLGEVRRGDLTEKELGALDLVPGDILFNRTNSRELVGKVAVVRELPQPVTFASYLVRLRTIEHLANPFWLGALLGSPLYQTRIRRLATPGVSQANVNPTSLKSISVPLPPLYEQQTVASVLDSADTFIEWARAERDALQSMKLSAADALLSGRVRVSNAAEPDGSKAINDLESHMNRSEVLQTLRAHQATLAEQFGVTGLTLFGSVARDQATDASDIDILAEFDSAPGWREYFGAQAYLEAVLGRQVDLMTANEVRPEIRPYVERDAIHV